MYVRMDMFNPVPVRATKREMKCVGKVLMLGGGRQSTAIIDMSILGELPKFDLVLFADTMDEPQYVYETVGRIRKLLVGTDTELQVVTHPTGLGIKDYMKSEALGRFAKMPAYVPDEERGYRQLPRQCTKEFKIEPYDLAIRQWLERKGLAKRNKKEHLRVNPGVYVEIALGFGADESYRVNRKPFPVAWKRKWFPLFERGIRTDDLVKWYEAKGIPMPRKSSCRICPYHEDQYWMAMPPDEFEEVCQFDDWMRLPEVRQRLFRGVRDLVYLHPSCKPLREVDFENWRKDAVTKRKRKRNPVSPLQAALVFEDCASSDSAFSCMS